MASESIRESIKVLLIEDNPGDARLVNETLATSRMARFTVEHADRLQTALARLHRPGIDVVLLDLKLPDSQGLETITRVAAEAPGVPIVAVSGNDDEHLVHDVVKRGADDFLVKGTLSTEPLVRAIRYAIDRKAAIEELSRARDSALESARLRAEFLANMSHEIRTPLNGVIGMTRLLVDSRLTTEQREMVDIARVSADSLLKIVNDILDFSKISAGKVLLEEVDFDLGTAVESVVQMFTAQAQAKGLALDSFIDGDVPVLLRGDAGRLGQVLTNLVGNAVKFTQRGEVTVRVGRVSATDQEIVLRFQVRDTGIGIPLEGQRYIFQAFSQADSSTTRQFGGTGLGLAISAQLVELMGGNIGVQSEGGGGAAFWFTCALRKQPAATQQASSARVRLEGVRVLVAEHSPSSGRMVREHLVSWGMRCETVTGPADTLAALKRATAAGQPFAAALLDMQFPEMDGLVLARLIKADPALAPIQLLGMYSLGGRPDEGQMKAAGIRAQLPKPIKQSQLFNTLTAVMAATGHEPAGDLAVRRRAPKTIRSTLAPEVRERVRLLLVEDNPVNQQVAQRLIERIGYRVNTVENGRVALEVHALHDYDIILMDCQMPELDGYAATREIRRREGSGRHTTIIGITAHALAGDREECLRAGMDDYIAKPVTPEDLAVMLDKWVTAGSVGQPGPIGKSASVEPTAASGTGERAPDAPAAIASAEADVNRGERPAGNSAERNHRQAPSDAAAAGDPITRGGAAQDRMRAEPLREAPIRDQPLLDQPVLDEEVLESLRDCQQSGQPDFLSMLIGVFLTDLAARLEAIRAALPLGDARRIRQAAHALKGAAGELGATRLRDVCERLELIAIVGVLHEAGGVIRELEREAQRAQAALEGRRAGLSA